MQRNEIISDLIESYSTMGRLMHRYFHDKFADSGIAASQLKLLHTISCTQPTTSSDLSKKLYLTPGAVTQLTEPLVQAGYVVRTPDTHDRRSICLSLSPAGEAKMDEVKQSRKELFETIVTSLSTEELAQMLHSQLKLSGTLEKTIHETKVKNTHKENDVNA